MDCRPPGPLRGALEVGSEVAQERRPTCRRRAGSIWAPTAEAGEAGVSYNAGFLFCPWPRQEKICPGEQKTLAIPAPVCYDNRALKSTYPGVAQMVARLNGVQEAAGSNPVTRTTSEQISLCSDVFLCLRQKRRHPLRYICSASQIRSLRLRNCFFTQA